jgi:hypothetical protein
MIEGSGSRSIPLTRGSGSREAPKHVDLDPVDPDLEHSFLRCCVFRHIITNKAAQHGPLFFAAHMFITHSIYFEETFLHCYYKTLKHIIINLNLHLKSFNRFLKATPPFLCQH